MLHPSVGNGHFLDLYLPLRANEVKKIVWLVLASYFAALLLSLGLQIELLESNLILGQSFEPFIDDLRVLKRVAAD